MAGTPDRNILVIEGQGGAGKTTAAQILSRRYSYSNFNTGTLFRATAAAMLFERAGLDEIGDFVATADYDISTTDPQRPLVAVRGIDVSDVLQVPEVTKIASHVGRVAAAADKLEHLFNSRLEGGNMVVEGKHLADRIGADATHMFFFIAERGVRAHRKWKQAQEAGKSHYTLLEAQLDTLENDSRDQGLLAVTANTQIIDTTDLSPHQVVNEIAARAGLD